MSRLRGVARTNRVRRATPVKMHVSRRKVVSHIELESLDERVLLSGVGFVNEPALASGTTFEASAAASDGSMWALVAHNGAVALDHFATNGAVTSTPLAVAVNPTSMIVGPDGNLWMANQSQVIVMSTAGQVERIFTANATHLADGPNGNVWYVGTQGGSGSTAVVGQLSPAGGAAQMPALAYPPTNGGNPTLNGIALGADGNMWFTSNSGYITSVTPGGAQHIYAVPQPVANATTYPASITAGPNGDLWFNFAYNPDYVGEINPAGAVTIHALSEPFPVAATNTVPSVDQVRYPTSLTTAADGSVWMATSDGEAARITAGGVDSVYQPANMNVEQPFAVVAGGNTAWLAGGSSLTRFVLNAPSASATATPQPVTTEQANTGTPQLTSSLVVADFTSADAKAAASDFIATVTPQGQSPIQASVQGDGKSGFQVILPPNTVQGTGALPAVVTINDINPSSPVGGGVTTINTTITLTPAPIVASANPSWTQPTNNDVTFPVASFNDSAIGSASASQSFTATINWGDGSGDTKYTGSYGGSGGTPINTVSSPSQFAEGLTFTTPVVGSNLGIVVAGTHNYTNAGNYTATITLTSSNGTTSTAYDPVTITPASWTATPTPIVQPPSQLFHAQLGTIASPAGSNPATAYSATVNWGDGATTANANILPSLSGQGATISGTHSYSLPGTYTVTVTVKDAYGNPTQTFTTAANIGSTNQNIVETLYEDLLHRHVDPVGLDVFSGELNNGTSVASVISQIESAPEGQAAPIQALYEGLLHRAAGANEVTSWVQAEQAGVTLDQIKADVLGSQEYRNDHGGTNAGVVSGMYQDVLGRAADAAGLTAFTQELASGMSGAQVATQIMFSQEGLTHEANADYAMTLGRPADTSAVSSWTSLRQHGVSEQTLVDALLSSSEFADDVAAGKLGRLS